VRPPLPPEPRGGVLLRSPRGALMFFSRSKSVNIRCGSSRSGLKCTCSSCPSSLGRSRCLLSLREANIGLPTYALDAACLTCPQTDLAPRRHTIREPAACSLPRTWDAVMAPGTAGSSARAGSTLLPVDDAEHQLQVLRDPRSSALMHFRDDASAAQRAADASGLVPHALLRLLQPEDRLATLAARRG
jgi:hypothetical protein